MRVPKIALALLVLCVVPASAGIISSIDPDRIPATEMEMFITVHGQDLAGNRTYAIYDGPAGHFEVQTQGGSASRQYVWLPGEIARTPGQYSIYLDAVDIVNGLPSAPRRSGPGYFEVIGSGPQPTGSRPPIIQTSGDVTAEATSAAGAVVNFQVTVSSVLNPNLQPTCTSQPNTLFAIGRTPVTCTASDSFGTAMVTFAITVQDTTPPDIAGLHDVSVQATSAGGATIGYDVQALDLVDGAPSLACTPPSGSLFANGPTLVTCIARDRYDNTSTRTAVFTVTQQQPPSLQVPPDIIAEATSPEGAVVHFNVWGSNGMEAVCTPPSGSVFPIGITTVSCTSGSQSGSFHVTVRDSTAPALMYPEPLTVDTTVATGVPVYYNVMANDVVDPSPTVVCTPPSGSVFQPGMNPVNCTATDDAGNVGRASFLVIVSVSTGLPDIVAEATGPAGAMVAFTALDCSPASGTTFPLGITNVRCAAGSFTVTVRDTTPPELRVPQDLESSTQIVTFAATATDSVDLSPAVTCSPASGATFPHGTTTVQCSATDDALNTTTASFKVTVTMAGLNLPDDMIVEATSLAGAPVSFVVSSSDGSAVTCSPASGSLFPFGTTTVRCSSATAMGSFDVTVRDSTGPVVDSIAATPNQLWPPDHKMTPIAVMVEAHDLPSTATTARITGVTANEDITGDWTITGPLTVEVRSERLGELQERIYSIVVEVTDHAGNVTEARAEVRVSQTPRPRAARR